MDKNTQGRLLRRPCVLGENAYDMVMMVDERKHMKIGGLT